MRTPRLPVWACFYLLLLMPYPAQAGEPSGFEDEFPPGLAARYTSGERSTDRVDPDIAFDWGGASPDPRLPAGPFEAVWHSRLLIRQPGEYRFHAYLQGGVEIDVDTTRVLTGGRDLPGWLSGDPVPLDFGERGLVVRFRKQAAAASVRIFWSSDQFPLEPVPGHLLFREQASAELSQREAGRRLFESRRCHACHRRDGEPAALSAPALTQVRSGLQQDWIVRKLLRPHEYPPGGRMPEFGFTPTEAADIAAFLLHNSADDPIPAFGAFEKPDEARAAGELLTQSVGCLACHQIGGLGHIGPYAGGDLSRVGRKRNAGWLAAWLAQPAKLNPDHRMPVFKLEDEERRQIAWFLSQLGENEARAATESRPQGESANGSNPTVTSGDAADAAGTARLERGRRLVEAARCAACHRVPGITADLTAVNDLSQSDVRWEASCLQGVPDKQRFRPAYADVDREALRAYVASRAGHLAAESRFDSGRRLLERQGCLACHERGASKGIAPTAGRVCRLQSRLAGQSEALIPPPLTAIGDKLPDRLLAAAVSGEQTNRRLPWLSIRMPRFHHTQSEKAALLEYLISHDRIPDHAPRAIAAASSTPEQPNDDSTRLVAAHTLVGAKGFSCIACHQLGRFEPKNVALGARGSDLLMIGRRMRPEYFLRWTRSPLRIVPGVEMPSYIKPADGLLGENIDDQLATIWNGLNDPRFTVPTDPSVVEQLLVVKAGEPARIVRDVFTNADENGESAVPRALAVGFGNGHSLLFDLDRFSVRQWTFGDFARQRTIGKSWYWDLAGMPVARGFSAQTDIVLRHRGRADAGWITPAVETQSSGRLIGYRPHGEGLQFEYALDFAVDDRPHQVHVTETWQPVASGDRPTGSGWERSIVAAAIPAGLDAFVRQPNMEPVLGEPTIRAVGRAEVVEFSSPTHDEPTGSASLWTMDSASPGGLPGGSARLKLHYTSTLQRPAGELKTRTRRVARLESITSVPGFEGYRLPLDESIMPTAITWTAAGTLAFTSLSGQVYLAHDTDGDGLEDRLTLFEEGLAAPYGILADGNDLIVSHKPELLRLRDRDGDGRADERSVFATGWGYTDNYHDWTCGIVRDADNQLYVGLGSDYTQKDRSRHASRWRGKVLRIAPDGNITPIAHSFRYPTGLAIDPHGRLFVTDNQGVQNPFNEINHVVSGRHYGVPSRHESDGDVPSFPPAIQLPHPWTRSVNGIFFLPADFSPAELAGHGIGMEYNGRFLIRFTTEEVGGVVQGATYAFSRPDAGSGSDNFLGPICGAISPRGDLYIGSLHDSGWLGGRNTGELVALRPAQPLDSHSGRSDRQAESTAEPAGAGEESNGGGSVSNPVRVLSNSRSIRPSNGIRELRAAPDGFVMDFFDAVDPTAAARPDNYSISGYTRVWQGGYATPDSGRHQVAVKSVDVADDALQVRLVVDRLMEGYVYDVSCGKIGRRPTAALWPATGHYTLHRIPPARSE